MRYVDDPSEAFGSWCVRGAGRAPVYSPKRIREIVPFDEEEIARGSFLLTFWRVEELMQMLVAHQGDPRHQRVIQEVIERKIRNGVR